MSDEHTLTILFYVTFGCGLVCTMFGPVSDVLFDTLQLTIGGDSAGSDSWHVDIRSDSKVFQVGPYVMGFTTSFRMGQLLRYSLSIGEPDTWDVDRFMATTFIDAVRDCLKAGGWATQDAGREEGGTFLVGIGGLLYAIHSDYQVARSQSGYAAVGSGYLAALGALHATAGLNPRDRIERALTAAADLTSGVRPPFTITSGGGT